jgi:hypothetical protein
MFVECLTHFFKKESREIRSRSTQFWGKVERRLKAALFPPILQFMDHRYAFLRC